MNSIIIKKHIHEFNNNYRSNNRQLSFKKTNINDTFFSPHCLKRFMGVYDIFGGMISEVMGFDGLWLGSYQISLSLGLPDDESFNPLISLELAINLKKHSIDLPVIIDIGSGFLNEDDLIFFSNSINSTNIIAVCIDDNKNFRVNSMYSCSNRCILSNEEFLQRIIYLKKYLPPNIRIIARTELITLYDKKTDINEINVKLSILQKDNNIHAFLPHYVGSNYSFIETVVSRLNTSVPIVLIPTGLGRIDQTNFYELGISIIIYANLDIRARYHTIKEIYNSIVSFGRIDDKSSVMLSSPEEIKELLSDYYIL